MKINRAPRAGVDYPRELSDFDRIFPDEEACRGGEQVDPVVGVPDVDRKRVEPPSEMRRPDHLVLGSTITKKPRLALGRTSLPAASM